ncbi:hypothetical protein HB364_10445 [Pseudoflavitalea sp. X16]|uniref:hypothetical protein n=1 Tax=Paraflavitalea devenefica TaxID=2716334 RepID=UPI0014223643|nr:hypothetical protein [Paraflavitalea devenefica]NII25503.1 hypothetical protein [Paraflavitalea devenefica]
MKALLTWINVKYAAGNMLAGYGNLPDEKGRKKMASFVEGLKPAYNAKDQGNGSDKKACG